MNRDNTAVEAMIPKGVKDFLPINAVKIEHLKNTLQQVFSLWGFQPVTPPSLEFLHVLELGLGSDLKNSTMRFDDRQSGNMLAFPPDITPQLARVFATRMQEAPLPQRLCYSCRVLRHAEQQAGKDREIFQSGVELIGQSGPQADAEVIAIAIESLQTLGAENYTIDIGQVEFFRGVLESLQLPPEQLSTLHDTILHKDISNLKHQLEQLPLNSAQYDEIIALPRLFGGAEVLDRAAAVVNNERSRRALDNLHQTLVLLEAYDVGKHITIDLGELRGLDYYTGITFQGFLSGFGKAICLGGRYDDLTGLYGRPAPATGFAFNLLNLLFSMTSQLGEVVRPTVDILLTSTNGIDSTIHKVARALRRSGHSTCITNYDSTANINYARKMNFAHLLTIAADNQQATLLTISDGSSTNTTVKELLDGSFSL